MCSASPCALHPLPTMHWLSVLFFFATAPVGLTTPIAQRWDDMRVKHSWDSIPAKWEHHGHPQASATIDLRVALKPHRENALIDALYEVSDPKQPKCVSSPLFHMRSRLLTDTSTTNADTARTYLRSKLLTLLPLIRTRSTSSVPGLHTMKCPPLRSQSRTAGVG